MNKIFPNHFIDLKFALAASAMSLIVGCASTLEPVKISSNASAAEEIALQHNLIAKAQADQVDVLAYEDFTEAKEYLSEAIEDHKDGDASNEVLETLGYSKAYLNKAVNVAAKARGNITAVAAAREAAIKGGARHFQDDLDDLDYRMRRLAVKDAKDINPEDKLSLQSEYIDLELKSIKYVKLNRVKNLLKEAKDKDAASITPRSYDQAVQKYNVAEKIIETDRHSEAKINPAVKEATVSATRVLILLESEQKSRNQTPEQRAMTLEARDLALARAEEAATADEADLALKENRLITQERSLERVRSENQEFKRKEKEQLVVSEAAAQFKKDEADVYRQGDQVIIRLKSMHFASGRSDLPANSIGVLTKVKDVIKKLGPSSVVVQGHTDAVGKRTLNQKLSEERAESVVKFFSTDKSLDENFMDSVGYGSTKPLASDKTKEGRAQNRRVDIIIKPQDSM